MVSSLRQLYFCQPFLLLPLLTSDYFAKLFEEVLKSRLTVKQLLASLSHILGGHLHGGRMLDVYLQNLPACQKYSAG